MEVGIMFACSACNNSLKIPCVASGAKLRSSSSIALPLAISQDVSNTSALTSEIYTYRCCSVSGGAADWYVAPSAFANFPTPEFSLMLKYRNLIGDELIMFRIE